MHRAHTLQLAHTHSICKCRARIAVHLHIISLPERIMPLLLLLQKYEVKLLSYNTYQYKNDNGEGKQQAKQ